MAAYFDHADQLFREVVGGWVPQTESVNSFSRDGASLFPGLGLYFLICTMGRGQLDQVPRKAELSVAVSELAVQAEARCEGLLEGSDLGESPPEGRCGRKLG